MTERVTAPTEPTTRPATPDAPAPAARSRPGHRSGGSGLRGSIPVRWRSEARSFAELFALNGLAIAQPVLDVFGRAPEHFIFRDAGRNDIVLFGLLTILAVPILAYVLEVLAGLISRDARQLVHLVSLGLLATALLTLAFDGITTRIAAITAAALTASAVMFVYVRTRGVRIWLAFLSPAPIAFLALFLFASPISPLMKGPVGALGTSVGRPTPTVVVLFDELPLAALLDENGDIDADLFPNFARLADTSHWFRQATTVSNTTVQAVPAMLTGVVPGSDEPPTSEGHPENLFTLVGGAMPVTSSEILTRMCPSSVCEQVSGPEGGGLSELIGDARDVLHQRLSPADPRIDPLLTMVEDDSPDGPAAAEGAGEQWDADSDGGLSRFHRFLDTLEGPDDIGLHFLHLLLPHRPYRYLPDGTTYQQPAEAIGRFLDNWVSQEDPVAVANRQFLLQLQWTDAVLGQLIDRMIDIDMWDRSNIVVIADHGYGMQPGGPVRAMEESNDGDDTAIAQILWVPFFVKNAGQDTAVISDDPVRTVDLTATVADLLDAEIPWDADGRSALRGGSGDRHEVGLYRSIAGNKASSNPYRTLDRETGHRLLLERTAGVLVPASDGVTGTDRIYRAGPRPELWQRPVPAGAEELEVRIGDSSRADAVDTANGPIPIVFEAVADEADLGRTVTISVNGTVQATTRVYRGPWDRTRVTALLSPEGFVDGANTIRVHALD